MTTLYLDTVLKPIGRQLFVIRHTRNEKLDTVARATGLSVAVISKIENGRYLCLSFKVLAILASYYKMDIREIISLKLIGNLSEMA